MLMDLSAQADIEAAITEWLLQRGKLDHAAVDRARRASAGIDNGRLHVVLTSLGLVSEADMAQAFSDVLGIPPVRQGDFPDEPVAADRLTARFLRDARAIPLAMTDTQLLLAVADPFDDFLQKAVRLAVGLPIGLRIAIPADIERAFERLYGTSRMDVDRSASEAADDLAEPSEDAQRLKDLASEAPVIKLVNTIISRAVEARASDVHIEPFEGDLRVRYRIDGLLRTMDPPPAEWRSAIVSRIKIMAKLNIAERRVPQDGRVKLAVRGQEIDFRVSTVPTMHGESVVMRILDKTAAVHDFSALGFDEETLEAYLGLLEQPNGIVLVTGPTGSGKTTTLYTSLLRLNTPDRKLITVEDPIEYQLYGINQIQVKAQVGLGFGEALRSILRQDPDVIMIGEIRDRETAQIAAQAALTGHVVLSTLHTNSAAGSVARLLDIGLEDYLLASTVNGIAAQRLVRILCTRCRQPHPAAADVIRELDLERHAAGEPIRIYRAAGCPACGGSGYLGRSAIAELLVMTDDLRRLALRKADARDIHKTAVASGMRTLYEDGLRKAIQGVTSIEEIMRVTRDV